MLSVLVAKEQVLEERAQTMKEGRTAIQASQATTGKRTKSMCLLQD